MKADPYGTAPMFDLPQAERPPTPRKATPAKAAPVWSKHMPKNPVKCDHCMAVLAENDGQGPHSRLARFKRKEGGQVLLLCYPHAQTQRTADKLPPLKKGVER